MKIEVLRCAGQHMYYVARRSAAANPISS
eukprot:COSAG01_NODE_10055_length_2261_cov_1.230342_1_plen_28_part_10